MIVVLITDHRDHLTMTVLIGMNGMSEGEVSGSVVYVPA